MAAPLSGHWANLGLWKDICRVLLFLVATREEVTYIWIKLYNFYGMVYFRYPGPAVLLQINWKNFHQLILHDDVIKWSHFRVTGHLCGGFTDHRWIPHTKACDARSFGVFFDLRLNKRLSKQPAWGWWFETPSRPLWHHCNGTEIYLLNQCTEEHCMHV